MNAARAKALLALLGWLRRVSALIAFPALLIGFGMPLEPSTLETVHALEVAAVGIFAIDALLRLLSASDKREHVRENRLEVLLLFLFLADVCAVLLVASKGELERWLVVGIAVYIVASVATTVARIQDRLTQTRLRPELLLLGSFLALIALGTCILLMPNCHASGARPWSVLDALFTATSAVCVTGLSVRDVGTELSLRGQVALLAMIQVGGLSLVALAAVITVFQRGNLRLRQIPALQTLFPVGPAASFKRYVLYAVALTAVFELAGAWFLSATVRDVYPETGQRMWWSLFHSVSAFCNAGFELSPSGLVVAPSAYAPLVILSVLIVVGGIGLPVLVELLNAGAELPLVRKLRGRAIERERGGGPRFSVHTKLTLTTSALLLVGGAVLFLMSEDRHSLAPFSTGERWMNSVFQSVSMRTAGFNTVDIGALTISTVLLMLPLMAIGAAPLSTGGGMKTTSAAVFFLTLRSMVRGCDSVEAFRRAIPRRVVNAAIAVVVLYGAAVVVVTAGLLATQSHLLFVDGLFESVSALSTVGLTRDVTPRLDETGRLILCAAMVVGRIGPVAVLWTLFSRRPALRYEYPEEDVVVS